jgi:Virulence protein RhuM family
MARLFGRDKSVIAKHLRNVFATGELARNRAVAKNATTAADGKTYQVEYFNLDAIISVGYRVNSKRGTQFRIWATRTLREHLLRGYTLNERRLREQGIQEVQQSLSLLARTLTEHGLVTDEGHAVIDIVQNYARAWRWLFEYDEGRLPGKPPRPIAPAVSISLEEAREAIAVLRSALLRGQGPPLHGRQQADRDAALLGVPPAQSSPGASRWSAAVRKQRDGGAHAPHRRERSCAEGPHDPPRPEPPRRRSVSPSYGRSPAPSSPSAFTVL